MKRFLPSNQRYRDYGSLGQNLGPAHHCESSSESSEDLSTNEDHPIFSTRDRSDLLERAQHDAQWRGAKRHLSLHSRRSSSGLQSVLDHDNPKATWSKWRKLKVFILASMCAAVTVLLLFFPEQAYDLSLINVESGHPSILSLNQFYAEYNRPHLELLKVTLTGRFFQEDVTALARHHLVTSVQSSPHNNASGYRDNPVLKSENWILGIKDGPYANQTKVTHMFDLGIVDWNTTDLHLVFETDANFSVPIEVQSQILSDLANMGILFGALILILLYSLILFEVAHRTICTMLTATVSIAVLATLDERPSLEEILAWVDIETIVLLFSMMLIVSVVSETGVFDYLGMKVYILTKGQLWPLFAMLCFTTAAVSALLDNVTTVLLMTPVIIQLCEALHVEPTKILIANVIFSNIGGAATAIGDPPNVLIASDPGMQAGGITFTNFTLHMSIAVVFVAIVSFLQLRLMFGKGFRVENELTEIKDLKREILIWHRTYQSLGAFSKEETIVKQSVNMKIDELMEELEEKEYKEDRHQHTARQVLDLHEFDHRVKLKDKILLIKSGVTLAITIILFFLSNFPLFNLSLGWTSFLGALTLLVLTDKCDFETILLRIEWATLIFFATLFVVMEALDRLGLLEFLGKLVETAIKGVPEEYQLLVAIVLILWMSGLVSAFIDNIPYTTMMIPIVLNLGNSKELNLPLQPLVWSLALGACLGGNGTLIGASANVVCAGIAEQHGFKMNFWMFFKLGFPITLVSLVVATIYLLICHVALGWNGA